MARAFLTSLLIAGALTPSAQAADSSGWLKERMFRVAQAAGQDADPVRVTMSDESNLSLEQKEGAIAVPRALIAIAPSPEAVDGLLALLLSYTVPLKPETRGPGPAVTFGGPTSEDRQRAGSGRDAGPSAPTAAPAADPLVQRKQRAWRGVGWYTRLRACTSMLTDYLRIIASGTTVTVNGKPVTWRASRPAREMLGDLGSLAYPSGEQCRERFDPEFEAVKADVAASLPASASAPQYGP